MTNEQTKLLIKQILDRLTEKIDRLDNLLPEDIKRHKDYIYIGENKVAPHLTGMFYSGFDFKNHKDYKTVNTKAIALDEIYNFIDELEGDIACLED